MTGPLIRMLDLLSTRRDALRAFCEKRQIVELAVFGSVLRDEFGPDSDIDFLATFAEDSHWSLLDHVRMQNELGEIVGRKIDLVNRRGVEMSRNPIRKHAILSTAESLHVQ